MHRDKACLHDVIASMRIVAGYIADKSYSSFIQDQACVDAVIRRLEIIGEATKRLSSELRNGHPDIPWQKMTGMRDRLIHGYDDVDLETVYNAVRNVIPLLVPQLEVILSSLPDPT